MGARPIAVMDPLRFGPLDDARTRALGQGAATAPGSPNRAIRFGSFVRMKPISSGDPGCAPTAPG